MYWLLKIVFQNKLSVMATFEIVQLPLELEKGYANAYI